jgi:hypothetical protein
MLFLLGMANSFGTDHSGAKAAKGRSFRSVRQDKSGRSGGRKEFSM